MKCNLSTTDRSLRVGLALVFFGAGAYYRSWWGLLGLAPLYNAVTGWCHLYSALGMSTKKP